MCSGSRRVQAGLDRAADDPDALARLHRRADAHAANRERTEPDVVDRRGEAELVAAAEERDLELARRALVEVGQAFGAHRDPADVHGDAGAERAGRRAVRRVCDHVAIVDNDQFGPVCRPHGRARLRLRDDQPEVGPVRRGRRHAGLLRERDPPPVR